MITTIQFGIDQINTDPEPYNNKRIGLVCNVASLTSNGIHTRIALKNAGFNLVKIFAPEHGFDAQGEDSKYIDHIIDAETAIPIVSLYSDKLAPDEEDLTDLDIVFIDLPDIRTRFYTYLWTMTYVLESCEKYTIPVVLLDRPNAIAHDLSLAEGPLLHPSCSSFIGRFSIPITHHSTFGELALYFKDKHYPKLQLNVVSMLNWNRARNEGYTFFPTSPAIQNRLTTYTYPGACLFEGLNIHEGRGTRYPFSQFGAPWIDSELLYKQVKEGLLGADVEIVSFVSTVGIYVGEECHGLRIIPKNPSSFQPVRYFIKLMRLINNLFPHQLKERNYLTNVNPSGEKHLDKLLGIPDAFKNIAENRIDTSKGIEEWVKE